MAELTNSRRRLDKVTYTPLLLPETDEGGGALETAAAVAALGLIVGEALSASRGASQEVLPALRLMDVLTSATDPAARLAASGKLAQNTTAVLTHAVDAIHAQRERVLTDCINELASIIQEYQANRRTESHESQTIDIATRLTSIEAHLAQLVRPSPIAAGFMRELSDLPQLVTLPQPPVSIPLPPEVAARLSPTLAPDGWAACVWADKNAPERARRFIELPEAVIPPELRRSPVDLAMQGLPFLVKQSHSTTAVKSSLTRRRLQPVGLLHLEQLVLSALDVERGELVYSLPLAPLEKVTLSHKEWSLREEEYARFVQDYMENYSERGVAEKSDMAMSTKSESEHTKTLSMSRPAAHGSATLADEVDTQTVAGDVTKESKSQEMSRRDTRETTEKASALAIRDQKVSFTVTTVSGTEDFTARLYENPHPDKVVLVDYFRRMRKWRNRLYRTGIRLTYDVVLPDPGRRLREQWKQLEKLDAQLATGFEFALGTEAPSSFASMLYVGAVASYTSLTGETSNFNEMSVEQLQRMGRQYGVTLPPAPNTLTSVEAIHAVTEAPPAGKTSVSFEITLTVPEGYRPKRLWLGGRLAYGNDDQYMVGDYWSRQITVLADNNVVSQAFNISPTEYASTTIPAGFIVYGGAVGEARAAIGIEPTEVAWRTWRSTVWALLRQGALSRWNEKRDLLRQQRAVLVQRLQAPDALSLRRMEREQVMHLVLEWLFPEFGKSADVYQALAGGQPGASQMVLEYGEYIKFVQEAIDWDRILVLLYPYFWDRPENRDDKLYLDHPDGAHREFLRAGAARIILAITPGFEERVVSLLDKGELGKLAPASRFMPVITAVVATEGQFDEQRRLATAPLPAGAEPDEAPSHGTLIGEWFDWTPTSALDMDVTVKAVLA
jgi:hypothetical protein